MRLFLFSIASIFLLHQKANCQDLYLFGTYEVTYYCDGEKVGDIGYYTFEGEDEEHGYIEYNTTPSKKYYRASWLGEYSLEENQLKITITDEGSGKALTRIINGKVEEYTVNRTFDYIETSGSEIILKNNTECDTFEIRLNELSETEYTEFMSKLK